MKCAELTGVETHRAESHRAETIFAESGPARVLPLKFLHVLEIDQGLLAHTPTETGPQKILIVNI